MRGRQGGRRAIGFLTDSSLGREYRGQLFVGGSEEEIAGGYLLHFRLTPNRQRIAWSDDRLADGVADNGEDDLTECESLMFGRNFGIATDIQTGPRGGLFVVSLSRGVVYQIYRKHG